MSDVVQFPLYDRPLVQAFERQQRPVRFAVLDGQEKPALKGRDREAIALMRYLQAQDLYDPVLDGLMSAFKYDKTYFDKIVRSVGPLMEKLTTGKITELISPNYLNGDDSRPIFEWLDVIRRNGIDFAKQYLAAMQGKFADAYLSVQTTGQRPVRLYFEPSHAHEWARGRATVCRDTFTRLSRVPPW